MNHEQKTGLLWWGVFTGIFSVLMAFIFWGTWSPAVSPVMPDDGLCHPLSLAAQFRNWLNNWVSTGNFTPIDFVWNGIFISKYWLQEFKYAAAGYCAALGLVYFLRGRGLSRLASYGAGLFLGFCGYWFSLFSAGHGGWFIWMTYGVFAFGFSDRAVRFGKTRHWILLGSFVAWASFYQADLWLLFTVFTGFYTLAVCAWERRFPWKGLLLSAGTFAVIAAPSVRNAFTGALTSRDQQIAEATNQGSALTGGAEAGDDARWIFVTNWSLPPSESLEFFIPRLNGDTSCPMTLQLGRAAGKNVKPYTGALGRPINATEGNYRQHSLYVGWMTCLLALIGILSPFVISKLSNYESTKDERQKTKDSKIILFFAIAAILFWLFSLGRYCESVYRLVYALPFGDYLRAPVKWHHLTEFCLCVLAAFGLEGLSRLTIMKGRKGAFILSALIVIGAADLARVNKLYCAPIDLRIVHGKNAAADLVLKAGKGKVADLVGNTLLSWSFSAHGVGMTANLNDKGVRFVWVGTQQVSQNQHVAAFLKARATPIGYFLVTNTGVRAVSATGANVALYQLKGVPPPVPVSPWKKPTGGTLALGLFSFFGTVAALVVAVKTIKDGCHEQS